MYLGEIAPSSLRGRIVGTNSLLVTGGQVIAYLVNAILFPVAHGWRWMVLASAVPAVVQLIGLLSLDESPRWLVAKGRFIQARRVLKKIYPGATEDMVENEVDRILENLKKSRQDSLLSQQVAATLRESGHAGRTTSVRHSADTQVAEVPSAHSHKGTTRSKWSQLFSDPTDRRALIIASGLMFFQQACGFNSIMYYSSRLLLMAGPPFDKNPNGFASLIAITNFIGTVIAMRFVDSWGRRKLMLWTTAAMSLSLALLAGSFAMIGDVGGVVDTTPPSAPTAAGNGTIFPSRVTSTTSLYSSTSTASLNTSAASPSHFWPLLSLLLMIFFTLSYSLGTGLIPWLILSEIFPNPSTRSLGSSLATCANWSMNLVWSASYLSFVQLLGGPAGTFGVFSVVSACSWGFSWWGIVELRGVELEEVGRRMPQQEGAGSGSGVGSARSTSGRFVNREEEDEERERFIVAGEDEEQDDEDEEESEGHVERQGSLAERTST
jgi:SP family myo-inositol transporter-like MFS transporter 13